MVVCEAILRRRRAEGGGRVLILRRGDIVTPAAWDFAREHRFHIEKADAPLSAMPVVQPASAAGSRYIGVHGESWTDKPEHMTHLRGNVLVEKTHPRIRFRGKLDTLQAFIIGAQITARCEDLPGVARDLGEILSYVRDALACEVKEQPFARETLLGLDSDGLRDVSHKPGEHYGVGHIIPDETLGKLYARLNMVRALSREAELAGLEAFSQGDDRLDLVQAMNRLSSGVYIVMCRLRGGYYGSKCDGE